MKQAHSVEDGKVFCASQGRVVDVISCFRCEKLVDIDLDSRRPRVVCAVPAPGEPAPAAS